MISDLKLVYNKPTLKNSRLVTSYEHTLLLLDTFADTTAQKNTNQTFAKPSSARLNISSQMTTSGQDEKKLDKEDLFRTDIGILRF